MKITVPHAKPRNPLAAAARSRPAGRHGRSAGGQRTRQRLELQRELRALDRRSLSP
jgi:hypothetical protein